MFTEASFSGENSRVSKYLDELQSEDQGASELSRDEIIDHVQASLGSGAITSEEAGIILSQFE